MISRCANYAGNVTAGIGLLPKTAGNTVLLATEAVSGLFFTALSAVTLGKVGECNKYVNKNLRETPQILPTAFGGVLRILNKEVKYDIRENPDVGYIRGKICFAYANKLAYAGLVEQIEGEGPPEQSMLERGENLFKRQIGSRLAYAITTVVALVCRVVDLIFGVIAAAGALISFGISRPINQLALKNLTIFGIINDFSDGIRGIVNPQQEKFGFNPSLQLEMKIERGGQFFKGGRSGGW